MPRHRLAVVLLVPPPVVAEVDGLRRGVGDTTRARIPTHITLVPPVNVPAAGLAGALAVARAAAATTPGPIPLSLGPATTFHPVTPVLYLAVGGDVDGLVALRDRVRRPPLERPDPYPFVPHVTLAVDMPADRIAASVTALADFRVEVRFDRLHVLEERQPGRVWHPVADAPFHPPAVVGRGGLPWELVDSQLVDPIARALLPEPPAPPTPGDWAITVRDRSGDPAGVAHGTTTGDRLDLAALVVAPDRRGQGIGHHLLAAVENLARRRSLRSLAAAADPTGRVLRDAGWHPAPDGSWHRTLGQ